MTNKKQSIFRLIIDIIKKIISYLFIRSKQRRIEEEKQRIAAMERFQELCQELEEKYSIINQRKEKSQSCLKDVKDISDNLNNRF
jgi:hypothetical protein